MAGELILILASAWTGDTIQFNTFNATGVLWFTSLVSFSSGALGCGWVSRPHTSSIILSAAFSAAAAGK